MSGSVEQEVDFSRVPENPVHVLFVGPALEAASKIFKRQDEVVRCDHAPTPADGLEMIVVQAQSRSFDCVMVDMRHEEDGNPLNVVAIAALRTFGNLTVLANAENESDFQDMVGVDRVLVEPIKPVEIIKTIVEAAPSPGDGGTWIDIPKANAPPPGEEPRGDEKPSEPRQTVVREEGEISSDEVKSSKGAAARAVTKGFESSLSKLQNADNHIWQRFVPLANFVYKKLAIIVLTALFLTFVTYGAMIVFFMSNSSWSMPFELSRGHVLVEKVERDLSSMRLRRNQIRQDLTMASVELKKAERERRDGQLQLTLTKRTVEEEISLHGEQKLEINQHIRRLKQVIHDFNQLNGKGNFAKNLESAYANRLITRRALNSGTLAVLETLHRIATVQNEISVKQLELQKVNRALEFLHSLLAEIGQPEVQVITSAGASLAHLAREVIEAKTAIVGAKNAFDAARLRTKGLNNSSDLISANIGSLEATPAARALDAPVMVLFVPYTNTDNLAPGQPLFSCAFSIIVCSRIGEVGKPIDGETVSVHPLFGKPMRGTFVEAKFVDPKSVTNELVHAGGAPIVF